MCPDTRNRLCELWDLPSFVRGGLTIRLLHDNAQPLNEENSGRRERPLLAHRLQPSGQRWVGALRDGADHPTRPSPQAGAAVVYSSVSSSSGRLRFLAAAPRLRGACLKVLSRA